MKNLEGGITMTLGVENIESGTDELQQKRCVCNKLLFILNGNNIEIKCNKCKRVMVIKTTGIKGVEIK